MSTNDSAPTLRRRSSRVQGIVLLALLAPLPFTLASPIVVDDRVVADWATYYGDDGFRSVQALAPVGDGVVLTLGRFSDADSGREALAHFDAAGNLQWRAFYGGNWAEGQGTITALASVPTLELIYVVGDTSYDTGIATQAAHQTARECFGVGLCGQEGFVAQFDASGALLWGSYFGGPFNEYIYDASATADGSLYICGETESSTGIATEGVYRSVMNVDVLGRNGGGFVGQFSNNGELQWASYYDGPCWAIAADPAGDGVVIAGWAGAGGDFASEAAPQPDPVGPNNAYLARFDDEGQRQWATYFGQGRALVHDLEVDATGGVYVVAATDAVDMLVTADAFQDSYGGGESDLYIARYTAGGQLAWSSYFGGESFEANARAALDGAGNLMFSATTSSDELATVGEPADTIGERADVIVAKFQQSGALEWAIYYGGEGHDQVGAIAVDPNGSIYLGGSTQSETGVATTGAHQSEPGGYQSAFVAMLQSN